MASCCDGNRIKMLTLVLVQSIYCIFISNVPINAQTSNHSDYDITPIELIRREGYEAEEHNVVTEDGYILTLHRIPGSAGSTPVFLQHGFLTSSFEWLISGKGTSLAFILADHGYDVWLGNARGTVYSRRHIKYNPSEPQFWDFSWHEMGKYDLPASTNYITKLKNKSLICIGHSMGTTILFVMASERPEMAKKVKVIFSLAPVAFFHHTKNPLRFLSPFASLLEKLSGILGIYELLPQNIRKLTQKLTENICLEGKPMNKNNICARITIALAEDNVSRFNYKVLPLLLSHAPEGTSIKTGLHYLQELKDGYFRKYDYGAKKNLEIYNNDIPPLYNLSKIKIPTGIFWSQKDTYYAHPLDVKKLYDLLPNKILNYKVINPEFSHFDFLIGIDSPKYAYSKLLSVMKDYQ